MCLTEGFYTLQIEVWIHPLHNSMKNNLHSTTRFNRDSKAHGANMGLTWVLSAPCWAHEPYYQGRCDCPSASKATLMNMDKYVMWIHYERLHNHNKAKHNKTVCIFLGIYCTIIMSLWISWTFLTRCHIQYIPRNMHTVLLCFALLWLCNRS